MAARGKKKKDDIPTDRQCFRHWVELRDLRDGTVRDLPVKVFQRILLVAKNKTVPADAPPEISLEVQDIGRVWKASGLEDLSRQLREQYPDGAFERTLKCVRDPEAEERRESALNALMQILVEVMVRQILEERQTKT